ncbi:hypothetical protein DICPUDRAFT_151113 [Dictyostelium purpureum]|uniref:Uncharacterized protein n=1 Tax=Dictyostelium purpureum TaxID=5786 RepID=F0ZI08_DICPU|nr:uncharacterized protein DICPUDRAFT_151113 [Dictyostelium purpureum]EGC36412.1 hypothetical protein DICPUDRAFT_151113 [Dictyostelium purpureum]|eukprot:XP_003287045.1 hypothetical protein DICPUDRAFT_151113 [Dictyostelium purpureum]
MHLSTQLTTLLHLAIQSSYSGEFELICAFAILAKQTNTKKKQEKSNLFNC